MPSQDFSDVNGRLVTNAQYQAALKGATIPGAPFPTPTTAAQRAQNARYVAQQQGISIDGGQIREDGSVADPNADHWYSDPRVLGPAAVGTAATLGIAAPFMAGGAAGGGATAAGGAGTLASSTAIPTATAMAAVPQVGAGAAGAGMGIGSAIKTGLGLLGDGLDIFGKVGNVATGAASGAADQRLREQLAELQRQQLAQTAARDQFDAGMRGAQFSSDERGKADKRGVLSALLSNLEDVNITGMNPAIASRMPTITGGLRPSALTGGGKREQLMAMLNAGGPTAPVYTPPPGLPVSAGASGGERALGAAGLFGNLLGAFKRQPAEERIR